MGFNTHTSSLHIPSNSGKTSSSVSVTVNPIVFFSILDHYLRRNDNQDRVIGTLLGIRSEDGSEVQIKNCFSVPHDETQDQVAVDMEYHRTMYELHQRVNPKEVIVGWYATGGALNSYSALIQDFYSREVAPFPAVHLTMDTNLTNDNLGVQAFTSSPIGVDTKAENCMFLPIPCEIKYGDSERSGLDILSFAKESPKSTASIASDMDNLERAIITLQEMLERVVTYVDSVLEGKVPANNTIGRFLMDTVSVIPKIDASSFEKLFNSHLQDLLMVVYLTNMTRAQLSIANSLQNLA
ncbi:Mov34-domain-containing protein [Basidiobolus meristosporus CBS 931.73]|uniref:Eukaryotic translation initiation factor 3 subunit F n=1 Tax=Basidiobolus meristosporus CBS 931.73 TaxID=1314790 RepID=A0A1Y1ZC08_9FUNG|nr:Mov34-domain-containing protein [Basidiobolus meristosporus CBS 931.73]|eukprot:ORY07831.1 Mov34-domain-containing protein [Basidiobolus meristosporus CBS 931.73]